MVRTESSAGLVILAGLGWACAYAAVALAWAVDGDDTLARCTVFAAFGWAGGSASTWLRLRFDPPQLAHFGANPVPVGAAVAATPMPSGDVPFDEAHERLDAALATDAAPLAH